MADILLNPVVDKLDDVVETHRDLYEARDGKFVLTKPVKIEDVSGLNGALAEERRLRKEAADKVKDFKDLPADWKERIDKADKLEREQMERQGQYAELRKSDEEKHNAIVRSKDDRIGTLTSAIERTMNVNAATAAINAFGGPVKALLPHVLPHLKTVEDEKNPGTFEVFVKDPKDPNKARVDLKSGEPFTVEMLVDELKQDEVLSKLFPASQASGSGGQGSTFLKGSNRMIKLSAEEAKDPKVYRKLREQKEKGEIDGALDEHGRRLV